MRSWQTEKGPVCVQPRNEALMEENNAQYAQEER
jgi:hypothetical protein